MINVPQSSSFARGYPKPVPVLLFSFNAEATDSRLSPKGEDW